MNNQNKEPIEQTLAKWAVIIIAGLLTITLAYSVFSAITINFVPVSPSEWAAWVSGGATSGAVVIACLVYYRDSQWKREQEAKNINRYRSAVSSNGLSFVKDISSFLELWVQGYQVLDPTSSDDMQRKFNEEYCAKYQYVKSYIKNLENLISNNDIEVSDYEIKKNLTLIMIDAIKVYDKYNNENGHAKEEISEVVNSLLDIVDSAVTLLKNMGKVQNNQTFRTQLDTVQQKIDEVLLCIYELGYRNPMKTF